MSKMFITLLIICFTTTPLFAESDFETVQIYGHVKEVSGNTVKLDTDKGSIEVSIPTAVKIKQGRSDKKAEIKADTYASISATKEGSKLVAYEVFVYPADDAHKHF